MRLRSLAALLVFGACGTGQPGSLEQALTQSSTEPLSGCFEAPPGDDNRNVFRFELSGDAFYLDTWNRSAGLPTTRRRYQLQGGLLSFDGGPAVAVNLEPDALVFPASGVRWARVDCSDFNW